MIEKRRQPQRARQVADAGLPIGMGPDDAEEAQSGWIREDAQRGGEPFGLRLSERGSQHLRATLSIDRLDQSHQDILTTVYQYVNVSTLIDVLRTAGEGVPNDERALLPG